MITDFIFNHVKDDRFNKKLDVLSICGMLVSFVVNSQSHLYFVMENIKKAWIFSTKNMILRSVFYRIKGCSEYQIYNRYSSHSQCCFPCIIWSEIRWGKKEYVVDFESVLTGFQFNKIYTGSQLFLLYADYDRLRDIQEFLIRIAFLKATLRYFLKN